MDKKQTRRVLTASLVGSSIEWFDYFLYGTMAALVFNQLFFVNEESCLLRQTAFLIIKIRK